MKIKVSESTSVQLNWMVAKCEGVEYRYMESVGGDYNGRWWWEVRKYSSNWNQGGPIMEREKIGVLFNGFNWFVPNTTVQGPTALIAAMRYYVASKLGDEVEIPEELL